MLYSPTNPGKGPAVLLGMLAATGQVRLFSDATGPTPIHELDPLLQALAQGADIASGFRYLVGAAGSAGVRSRHVDRVMQRVLPPSIVEAHCGCKAFRAAAMAHTFAACTLNGWSFGLEVLVRACAHGFRVREVLVRWDNDKRSKAIIRQLP